MHGVSFAQRTKLDPLYVFLIALEFRIDSCFDVWTLPRLSRQVVTFYWVEVTEAFSLPIRAKMFSSGLNSELRTVDTEQNPANFELENA